MSKTPIEVKKVDQEIKSNIFNLDVPFMPVSVRNYFTDNIFKRSLSYLVGAASNSSKMLRCDETGVLLTKPASSGTGLYEVKAGTQNTTYSAEQIFVDPTVSIVISIWDADAIIKLSADGDTYQGEIEIPFNTVFGLDFVVKSFQIKTKTGATNTRYQVVGVK